MPATVVILTKLPGHLPVKTRLVPALGEAGARAVYLEMLHDTVALARRLTSRPILAYSPPDATPDLPGIDGCELRPVAGDDGATCLENALADAYVVGNPLLALGGDAPDLPLARLAQVVATLRDDRADAVLVPTDDGGFSCLGLRRPVPGLARGFRYGSADSLASLRAFLAAQGLVTAVLEPWPDIDTPQDLEAYRNRS
ncbi:MAG: TIGR04282 family arsenosugar biosynthesis glycosyltransferase [Planctomycetota bacterium]